MDFEFVSLAAVRVESELASCRVRTKADAEIAADRFLGGLERMGQKA